MTASHISVVQRESGGQTNDLPVWTDDGAAIEFDAETPLAIRQHVIGVPGCLMLENVLSAANCDQFVRILAWQPRARWSSHR